jgi:hypothetical protein
MRKTNPLHFFTFGLQRTVGVSAQDRLVRPSVRPLQTQGGETAGRASLKEV